jgi:outer membrane protein assembly factor BamA
MNSCSNTKHLRDDQSLLISNSIIIQEDNFLDKNDMKNELKKLARQQPNKKFIGFWRLRLSIYNAASRKNPELIQDPEKTDTTKRKFNQWLRTKIGEPPVIFDSTLMSSSQLRMQQHLFNNGYFNSEVTSDFTIREKKKKVKVNYYIDPKERYYIDDVEFAAEDSAIEKILFNNLDKTVVLSGAPYEAKVLDEERVRLTNAIQDEGYFTFNRGYIIIEVDTFMKGNKTNVFYNIKNPADFDNHQKYYIGNVSFDLQVAERRHRKVDLNRIDTADIRNITTYLPHGIVKVKPIVRSIFFNEDSLYRKSDYNSTLRRLNGLNIFRSVNIKFDPFQATMDEGILDTRISATLRKKQTVSLENEFNTDSKSSLGIVLATSYMNRNIFKSANRIEFNLSGGMELQLKREDESENPSVLNTVELRSNMKIRFPEVTIPYKRKKLAQPIVNKQESNVSLQYEFERRLGFYTIHKATIGWQQDWYMGSKFRHLLSFPSLEIVAPNESSFSDAWLETLEKFPSLKRSFEPQLIASVIDYSFIYNSGFRRNRHSLFFRGRGKGAGNIAHGIAALTNKNAEKPIKVLGIEYSQFVRLESDIRHYFNFGNGNTVASRFFAGVGIPYGNVDVLPFTEQFYAGGNQSMRGWNYRALGPGGFDTRTLTVSDQAGDIQLELNTEFRFTIYKFFKAALFMDVGNIWLLRKDEDREDAEFRFTRSEGRKNSFIDEIAMNLGVGIRLDFNFFVVRLDAGLPIRDPAFDDNERWQFDKIDLSKGSEYRDRIGLRIAIGYPF